MQLMAIGIYLKWGSHVPENFCQIKVIPSGVHKKIASFVCLVFKNEDKWILKL